MIQIVCVDDPSTLAGRREEWNSLVERSESYTVYQSYEWHASWWRAFGVGARGLVLLAEEDGELVGIAPLMLSSHRVLGRRRRVVEFMGSRASDYGDFVVDHARPEVLPALVRWLVDHAADWDLLLLTNIRNDDTLDALIHAGVRARLPTEVRGLCNAPSHRVTDADADRQLLGRGLQSRQYRFLQRHGGLAHEVSVDTDALSAGLDGFFRQHIRRRGQTDAPSKFLDARWCGFYRDLARTLGSQGRMLLMATTLAGSPIAYDLCFEHGGRLYGYDRSFDLTHAKHSPGRVALWFMFAYLLDHGLHELDMGRGDEPYKLALANHTRVNWEVKVYRSPLSRAVDRLVLRAIGWVEGTKILGRSGRWLTQLLQDRRWGGVG